MEETREFEVNPPQLQNFPYIVLVRDVLKRWFLIFVVAVIAGVGTYIVSDQSYRPVYQTSTTLVVTTRDSTSTVYSNLKSTTELASVFSKLLNSSIMRNAILEELGMTDFDGTISASAIAETNLITVRVTARDPRTAFLVMESVIENHRIVTYEVVGDLALEVLQLPRVATGPSNPFSMYSRVRKGMLLAALLACALIVILSYTSDTVRSKKEAEQKLRCWCLGEIHHEKKRKTAADWIFHRKNALVITNPANSFYFVETIRKLRRRVEQYMAGGKVLMVTSVMENEGKSTVAVNLALSLAQKHKKVLLIDLDLRKPACHKILEQKGGSYGTYDVISGRAELARALVKEPLSGLELLLERTAVRKTDNLLSGRETAALIETARSQYDYVVLDLPPMSAAPDTEYVMEYADAALLVVQQNQVRAKALNRAISTLEGGKAKLLGCVLNNVYSSSLPGGSGGGYGYGSGSIYGYGKYGGYGTYGKPASRKPDTSKH